MNALDLMKVKLSRLYKSKVDKRAFIPIGVMKKDDGISLILRHRLRTDSVELAQSKDGFDFRSTGSKFVLVDNQNYNLLSLQQFVNGKTVSFLFKHKVGQEIYQRIGILNENTVHFQNRIAFTDENAAIVSDFFYKKQHVMYYGDRAIRVAYTKDFKKWDILPKPVIIDSHPIEVGGVYQMKQGLLLLYFKKEIENEIVFRSAYLALFDKKSPDKLLWKTPSPVWKQKDHWTSSYATHLGTIMYGPRLMSYWYVNEEIVYAINISGFTFDPKTLPKSKKISLTRHVDNPIITPKPTNGWEAFNTFNPAAVKIDEKIHILYRAQGYDYISTIGYAVSRDGIHIDERFGYPIYSPRMNFEQNDLPYADPNLISGGGYGGCEDPRITRIGDRIYMVYVAFDGWSPQQLALTSIHIEDFLKKRWNWSKPILISPPGVIDKSGCLLPEKINGKYVFFHRVFPNILVDYVDDLNFKGKTKWLQGKYQIKIRENMWDSRKIGAGAPPIKTKDGWLLIYYGVDDRDASKYHIGAMLLDLKDPTTVLHRSNQPILEPIEKYEINGFKPGIAYPCGAVIVKDQLLVYYGGADSVVCVATAPLETFLNDLKSKETARLEPIQIREIDY